MHVGLILTSSTVPVTTSAKALDASEARMKRIVDNEVNFILTIAKKVIYGNLVGEQHKKLSV